MDLKLSPIQDSSHLGTEPRPSRLQTSRLGQRLTKGHNWSQEMRQPLDYYNAAVIVDQ